MNLFSRCIRICSAAAICCVLSIPSAWATMDNAAAGETLSEGKFSFGYRSVNPTHEHRRALEYSLLEASPTFELKLAGSRDQRHFHLEANYLNEEEHFAEAHLDNKGLLKLNLSSESLYHNLEHIPYEPPFRNDADSTVSFEDQDPGDDYHVEVERSSARVRAKLRTMPAHLNLSYWRLERKGRQQQRFLDENCTSCHMESQSRNLDRVTEEVTAGVDAHLGPVDVIFEQLFRQFREKEPIPSDSFGEHRLRSGSPPDRQHDEVPDSRLTQSTVKMHTSLAGGFVGAATFSLGKRENLSDLSDVYPVKSETDFRKAAGDVTYIPSPGLTLNFRYRLIDLDNDNTNLINAEGLVVYNTDVDHNPVDVRENIDLTRASYAAAVSYRPSRRVTLKGNFERVEIHRDNTGGFVDFNATADPIVIDPVWELPEDENINRYRLSIYARPLGNSKLRVNGWYQYRTSDDPAYGASAEESHQLFFGGNWVPSSRWGASANVNLLRETNNDHGLSILNGTEDDFIDLDRERESGNLAASIWVNFCDALGVSLNYGYLRSRTIQDLLFGNTIVDPLDPTTAYATRADDVEYFQRVHSTTLAVNWRILANLKALAEARYVDSFSNFDPEFAPKALDFGSGPVLIDASDIKQLSEVDIRQTGLRFGLDWSPTEVWTCSLRYTFDDYEDRNSNVFDGSAETYMVSLARSW